MLLLSLMCDLAMRFSLENASPQVFLLVNANIHLMAYCIFYLRTSWYLTLQLHDKESWPFSPPERHSKEPAVIFHVHF